MITITVTGPEKERKVMAKQIHDMLATTGLVVAHYANPAVTTPQFKDGLDVAILEREPNG